MKSALRIRLIAAACVVAALALSVHADTLPSNLVPVNNALQAGQADKALSLLASLPQGGQSNAQALNLSCRVQFTLARWDAAIHDCEQAIRLDPQNARYHLWLGRVLGEKASRASFLSAFSLAKRVVAEFQKATQLDGSDPDALFDLGTFYAQAPSIVGGGTDKAQSLVAQLDRMDQEKAWELRAQLDKQRKDYGSAENNLKKALSVSRHPAFEWATLARFYLDRKRWNELDMAIRNCESAAAHDPHAAAALYDAADVLLTARRDPATGVRLLQQYLAASTKTESAPAFVAYSRLAWFQQQIGDAANAQSNRAAAFQLARDYQPEQDLKR